MPFQVDINSSLDQVCIIFYPSALRAFTTVSYADLMCSDAVFETVFSKRSLDVEMPEIKLEEESVEIIDLVVNKLNFFSSTSEARRLIQQGGFKIGEEAITDVKAIINIENGMVIRAGKKKMVKIIK